MCLQGPLCQCRIGLAQTGKGEVGLEQRCFVGLLAGHIGHCAGHIGIYLVGVGRGAVVSPEHRSPDVFVAFLLGAVQAQFFSVI